MLASEEIDGMSAAERLSAMEQLWASFAKDGIDYPSPDWHAEVLEKRAKLIDSGDATTMTVDELQARLQDR